MNIFKRFAFVTVSLLLAATSISIFAQQVFSNRPTAVSVVKTTQAINAAATSVTVDTGSAFESPTGNQWQTLTIWNCGDPKTYEAVSMSARSTNTLTIARAQDGTSAATWASGSCIGDLVTAGTMDSVLQNYNASGTSAIAIDTGGGGVASGNYGISIGTSGDATAESAISIGRQAQATGSNAIAIGGGSSDTDSANALAADAISIGNDSRVTQASSIAIGQLAEATGTLSTAIGESVAASGADSTAVGGEAVASGDESLALGGALASAANASAIGYGITVNTTDSWGVRGLPVMINDDGETNALAYYTAVRAVICSDDINAKTLADDVDSLTFPTGTHFYTESAFVVATDADTVSGQPNVAVGSATGGGQVVASAATSSLTADYEREPLTIVATTGDDGITAVYFSIKTAATGTTLNVRVCLEGVLIQDE